MSTKFLIAFAFLIINAVSYSAEQSPSCKTEEPKEMTVCVNDAKLFCRTMGKGEPLVVLHGGPGLSQDYLLPQMYKLAENNFVIFYDQRGSGQSTGEINPNVINIETYVNDLEAIRKEFKFDKISVLGHSWGGFLAVKYAISYPENVDKLILSNSMPISSDDYGLFFQEYLRITKPFEDELTKIQSSQEFKEGDPETSERFYRIIFRTYCYLPEKADLLNLKMTPEAARNVTNVYQCFSENLFAKSFDLYPSVKQLKISTLVIHGDTDCVPYITAKNIHESIENSKYVLMERCGHFPFVEDSDVYFNHVNSFLK